MFLDDDVDYNFTLKKERKILITFFDDDVDTSHSCWDFSSWMVRGMHVKFGKCSFHSPNVLSIIFLNFGCWRLITTLGVLVANS